MFHKTCNVTTLDQREPAEPDERHLGAGAPLEPTWSTTSYSIQHRPLLVRLYFIIFVFLFIHYHKNCTYLLRLLIAITPPPYLVISYAQNLNLKLNFINKP